MSLVNEVSAPNYKVMFASGESTVCAKCPECKRSSAYQSEDALEQELIKVLCSQGYEYVDIHDNAHLIANLRLQIEKLNDYKFSDKDWDMFFKQHIASQSESVADKTRRIQDEEIITLVQEDGSPRNIKLIDKANIHNNKLQVLNQYEVEGARKNRYDVTILVNGLPLVHIELKRRGVNIKQAFNQIERYKKDSFWADSGLYEYIQIFVISNGTYTKYYANTTRERHVEDKKKSKRSSGKRKTSNSYEFTSYWADYSNTPICDLIPFAKTFLSQRTLLNVLTRYCVFTTDDILMVMRPYQIAACECILSKICIATNEPKKLGTLDAGGYIWHTTGSGKTLTSFKTAQLATKFSFMDKVMFVVDRKDLDYQTMKEFNKFEEGAVNSNKSTKVLTRQLEDPSVRIIVTTIQKLDNFIKQNNNHPIYNKHVTIIFDECHRSHFGDMHVAITKHFKKYHLFGFTGTPIFAQNAGSGKNPHLRTTSQAFGQCLHVYTIIDAIRDENVLPFRIDYINTMKEDSKMRDEDVYDIDREKALLASERIDLITNYILDHFNQKTKHDHCYKHHNRKVNGFNSIFAVQSIDAAKRYYSAFKRLQEERGANKLKVGIIYSWAPNADSPDGFMGEESFDTSELDKSDRDFLDRAIADYNNMFKTSFSTNGNGFENYYKDVSNRMKNRELDVLIVVNMFLTGFDATTLNTLWVDKNLRMHGLIQAFSRTNRILNSIKTFGNIVCFRDLKENVDQAIARFGDTTSDTTVVLKPYKDYFDEYTKLLDDLYSVYKPGELITGEQLEKDFIVLWSKILRLRNILTSFDEFEGEDILKLRDYQDFNSMYLKLYDKYRNIVDADKTVVNDDIVFEIELVQQDEVNIDYILMMIEKYKEKNSKDKEIVANIDRYVNSSPVLRDKRDLIVSFVEQVSMTDAVTSQWTDYVKEQMHQELFLIIEEENLNKEKTEMFIKQAFLDGYIEELGSSLRKILPPVPLFDPNYNYSMVRQRVLKRLQEFFDKYYGLS